MSALASICEEANLPLVHVSTDYVFDGSLPLGEEYPEDYPLAPLSVYGASKAAGEVAAAAWRKHYTLRTSWVVGAGKNFVGTILPGRARHRPVRGCRPVGSPDLHPGPGSCCSAPALLGRGIRHLQRVEHRRGYQLKFQFARAVYEGTMHDPARVSDTTTEAYFANAELFAHRPTNSAMDLSS